MKHRCSIAVVILLANAGVLMCQDNPHGNVSVPCNTCHSTESWKVELASTRFDHAKTRFALSGQHLTVSCRQCHLTLKFSEAPVRCASCHDDIHRGELGLACDRCHTPQSWLIADMPRRHGQTRFPLTGMHLNALCEQCHVQQQKHQYVGLSIECYGCHKKDYHATVAPAHAASGISTECASCHSATAASWNSTFSHAQTGFALTGAHVSITCASCHVGNSYKGTPTDCYACHQQDYTSASIPVHSLGSFPTTCVACHSTSAWRPSTFNHTSFFPISAGTKHAPGRWNACSDCHTSATNFAVFSCLNCHEHNQTSMDSKHSGRNGYTYESQACYSCHPRGNG